MSLLSFSGISSSDLKLMPAKTQPYCTLPKLNQSSSRPQINSCQPKSYKYQSLSSKSLLPAQINSNINY